MIRYTITAEDSRQNIAATAIIESPRVLVGTEPVIAQRIAALEPLLEPEDEYMAAFREAVNDRLHKEEI